ncbi:MAG: hypothetical protein C0433_12380 [Cyclobacterium sp.]|nr:hypothetical protein [Cyclobacterium sp.]
MKIKFIIPALLIMSLATGSKMKSSSEKNSRTYDRTVYIFAFMTLDDNSVLVSNVYPITDRDELNTYDEAMNKLSTKLYEHAINELKLKGRRSEVGANYEFTDRNKLESRRKEIIAYNKGLGRKIVYPAVTFGFSFDYRRD